MAKPSLLFGTRSGRENKVILQQDHAQEGLNVGSPVAYDSSLEWTVSEISIRAKTHRRAAFLAELACYLPANLQTVVHFQQLLSWMNIHSRLFLPRNE